MHLPRFGLKAAPLLTLGIAIFGSSHSPLLPQATQFCASPSRAQTTACCRARQADLPFPLATGRCETSVACVEVKGLGGQAGPVCKLMYAPAFWEFLKPDTR